MSIGSQYPSAKDFKYFVFPLNLQNFLYASSSERLSEVLKSQMESTGVKFSVFKSESDERISLYCKSSCFNENLKCLWKMIYYQQHALDRSGRSFRRFKLSKFHLQHSHGSKSHRFFAYPGAVYNVESNNGLIRSICELNLSHQVSLNYLSLSVDKLATRTRTTWLYTCAGLLSDNFHRWYRRVQKSSLEVYLSPPISQIKVLPNLVMLTNGHLKGIYQERGHIIGIKIVRNILTDLTEDYREYAGVFFYGFARNDIDVIFAFAVLPIEPIQTMASQQIRISSNLYKIIRIFLQTFGDVTETLVIENDQIAISTCQYLIATHPRKIEFIIDPFSFLRTSIPERLHPFILALIHSKNQEDYRAIYGNLLNKSLSKSEHEVIEVFHLHRERYLLFSRSKPKFTGLWFDKKQETANLQYTLKLIKKSEMITILTVIGFVFEKLEFKDAKVFQRKISYECVEHFLNFQFVKDYRMMIYADAFRVFSKQIYESFKVNILRVQNKDEMDQQSDVRREQPQQKYYEQCIAQANLIKHPALCQYQQLYPLGPESSVKIDKKVPFQFQVKYKDKVEVCRRHACPSPMTNQCDDSICTHLYECSCDFTKFTGIPCCHIIKVCLKNNWPLINYFHKHWIMKASYNIEREYYWRQMGLEVPRVGYPKKSARNSMRNR